MPDADWTIVPVLGVRNVREAAEYYRDVFGFSLDPVNGVFQPIADEPGGVYAIVRHGAASIHFQIRRDGAPPRQRQSHERDVYIYVDDVDAVYAKLVERGARITQAPRNERYGVREVEVEDLNGYRLTFGQIVG